MQYGIKKPKAVLNMLLPIGPFMPALKFFITVRYPRLFQLEMKFSTKMAYNN